METKIIRINWAAILAFCTFWTYAFYAAVSGQNKAIFYSSTSVLFFIGSSLILTSIFILFLVVYFYKKKIFEDEFKYCILDRNVLILYLLVMLLLSWPELNNQINGDHLFHVTVALMHATQVTYLLAKKIPPIESFEFRNVVYVINTLLLIGSCIFIYVTNKLPRLTKIILYTSIFFLFRFAVIYLGGGYQDQHPPLRLFPIWLTSTIFYPSNFSFRFCQFIGLIILMFISYKFTYRYFSAIKAILFGFVVGTIPILWHVGVLVEFSIWSSLCVTYLLYVLLNKAFNENYTFNLVRISSVVSIGILLRQPNIACVFLLMVIFFYSYYYENHDSWRKFLIYLFPLLIALPFTLKSMLMGTPATNSEATSTVLSGVFLSITSKIGFYGIVNGALYWIVFIPFILLLYRKNKIIAGAILLFLLMDYIQFYSIRRVLWGAGKYQAEYVIPFAVIGFFLFSYFCIRKKYIYIVTSILLVSVNIYVFKNIYNFNKSSNSLKYSYFDDVKKLFGCIILSEFVYPYNKALVAVKNAGYSEHVYLCGTVYGILPQILAGYIIKDVVINHHDLEKTKGVDGGFLTEDLAKKLNDNRNVKIILFEDLDSLTTNYLKLNGWSSWKSFYDQKHKSRIEGLIRSSETITR